MTRLKDIAEKMGISVMTVSRAINTPALVKPELLKKILKVADELNYVPHHGARSMASNKTGIIQLVTGLETTDFYFMLLQAGIVDYLSKHGFAVIVGKETKLNFRCDGIIVMGLLEGEREAFFEKVEIPTVLFGKTRADVDYVDADNEGGIAQSVEYLFRLGHRNIAFFAIESEEPYSKERLNAFTKAMKRLGLSQNANRIVKCQNDRESSLEASKQFFKSKDFTALVCSSDLQAMAFMDAAREEGIKIPDDISIVGFDGLEIHKHTTPRLTTIVQPVYKIGQTLSELLVRRITEPKRRREKILIELSLEEAESVKALKR